MTGTAFAHGLRQAADGSLTVTVAGESVQLCAERGMYVPQLRTLVVTDLHWGKAASFRAAHIPLPSGTTAADLARLARLVERTGAEHLVVLGDLIHARAGRHERVLTALQQWRDAHASLAITLVRGNHDRHAGDPPELLRIQCVDGPWVFGPFTCAHEPDAIDGAYVLAGHLHPSVTVRGKARQHARLCCFAFGPEVGILPAFASFTGGGAYVRDPRDRIYAIAEDDVIGL